MIRWVHDGWLVHKLVDPEKILRQLGLKSGDTVFEIGCGPGFYSLAASKVIGPDGVVHAYEINPHFIPYLENKLLYLNIKNVNVVLGNANATSLENNSIDFAFVFGVPRIVGGMEELVEEIRRVLKPDGLLVWNMKEKARDDFARIMARCGYKTAGIDGRYLTYTLQ